MVEANESESNRPLHGITPGEAFACAAAVVAALGLAFSLGRYVPLEPAATREPSDIFETVYSQPPIPYQRLQVDRGDANERLRRRARQE